MISYHYRYVYHYLSAIAMLLLEDGPHTVNHVRRSLELNVIPCNAVLSALAKRLSQIKVFWVL